MYGIHFIPVMIGADVLGLPVASEMDNLANDVALEFAHKWLDSPKLYVDVVLPNKRPLTTRDVVGLLKKINTGHKGRQAYFIFNSNVTIYNTISHTQNELVWFPFDIKRYDLDCRFLDYSRYAKLYKKHFLFRNDIEENPKFSFESCKVRFDSRLVIYRREPSNNTTMRFEEIYKMDENGYNLEKNTLGEVINGQKEMLLSGLNSFIWKRRKTLNGKTFTALSKDGPSMVISAKHFADAKGKAVIQHGGYFSDIMRHLMKALNFSLNTRVLPMPFNDIVMEVGSGMYDIGYYNFALSHLRSKYADFSHGLLAPNYGLFYVKENRNLFMETFLHPFTSPTWILLTTYVVLLISGFIIATMMTRNRTSHFRLKQISDALENGSDMVLRSLIAKSHGSEPLIGSSKVFFLSIVCTGFLIFYMYQAALVAFLATEEDRPPINSLKDLFNSEYSLVVRKGSATESIFFRAATESKEYQLSRSGKIVRILAPAHSFVDLMVEKDPKAAKTILFHLDEHIQAHHQYPCNLSKIKGFYRRSVPVGLVFRKNWPWTDMFNYHLLVMKERGLLERLYQLNKKKHTRSCPNEHVMNRIVKDPRPVGTDKAFSLYVCLMLGFAASLLLLLAEKLLGRQPQFKSH